MKQPGLWQAFLPGLQVLSGNARKHLPESGLNFEAGISTVVTGKGFYLNRHLKSIASSKNLFFEQAFFACSLERQLHLVAATCRFMVLFGFFFIHHSINLVAAQEGAGSSGLWQQDYLLGDRGEERSNMEEKGLVFEFVYTGEIFRNTAGGIKRGERYQGNIDLTLTMDTGKNGWWNGGTFFIYGLNDHGGGLSEDLLGDLQTVSNIEAYSTSRLYQIWYEHNFLDGDFSVLLGMHDLNSEFNVTEYGGLFINSSFGIEPDISANVPVSIFPVAAPAVRIKLKPGKAFYQKQKPASHVHEEIGPGASEAFYIQAAVYDGDPGAPEDNKNGFNIHLSSDEGAMSIFEMGYSIGRQTLPGVYKLGGWYHSGKFDDAAGNSVQYRGNYGIYFIADQFVYSEQQEGGQGLGLFLQVGGAPGDRNTVDFYIGGGMHYLGLIPGRDEDEFGIAVAHASISNDKRSAENLESAETTLEVTYLANITPWLSVQPDFQYVMNPSTDKSLKNTKVLGVRFGIVF